jgi:hypothetical protein
MNFNNIIGLILNNSPKIKGIKFVDTILTKDQFINLYKDLSNNQHITEIKYPGLQFGVKGSSELKVYSSFIENLLERNRLAQRSALTEVLSSNFQKFFIEPLMYFTSCGEGLIKPFLDFLKLTNSIGEKSQDSSSLTIISTTEEGLVVSGLEVPPMTLLSKLFSVPTFYLLYHTLTFIGFTVGLTVSLLLSPFSLAKSLFEWKGNYDAIQSSMETNKGIIESDKTKAKLDYFFTLSLEEREELKITPAQIMELVDSSSKKMVKKAIKLFQQYPEDHKNYEQAMHYCGQLLLDSDTKLAIKYFTKADVANAKKIGANTPEEDSTEEDDNLYLRNNFLSNKCIGYHASKPIENFPAIHSGSYGYRNSRVSVAQNEPFLTPTKIK